MFFVTLKKRKNTLQTKKFFYVVSNHNRSFLTRFHIHVVLMSPVSLVFHTIVTVKSISKMHLKQTHPFYSIIGSKNYWLAIIATSSEHLPCRSFGYFRLDYQGLGKVCRRSVLAYLPVKHTRCQYFCKFKACLKGS